MASWFIFHNHSNLCSNFTSCWKFLMLFRFFIYSFISHDLSSISKNKVIFKKNKKKLNRLYQFLRWRISINWLFPKPWSCIWLSSISYSFLSFLFNFMFFFKELRIKTHKIKKKNKNKSLMIQWNIWIGNKQDLKHKLLWQLF